jgi:tripartite-type tricarboxylate transporter receptor subunit TctC
MIPRRRILLAAPGLALAAPASGQTGAIAGPARLVVPFPPGGGTDTIGRILQPYLQAALGVPVVVENRAGRSGATATAHVARSAPDGRTWLLAFDTHVVNPSLLPELGYDSERDLAPVLLIGTFPMLILARRARGWLAMEELLYAARRSRTPLTCATTGNGSLAHVTLELMGQEAGTAFSHVPYRGGVQVVEALLGGEVDFGISTGATVRHELRTGQLLALAQTGAERAPSLAGVPTLEEVGLSGIDARSFWGVLGPAGLPPPLRAQMEAALRAVLAMPEVEARLEAFGIDLVPQGPAAFAEFLARETARWAAVVQRHGIRPD